MEWEFDEQASTAYPLYSRAVVGDLCPDPVTPLTATAGVGAELGPAWTEVYAETGLRPLPGRNPGSTPAERTGQHPVSMFGAYLYLNTTMLRLFGVYATGADPMAFARQYLGERPDVPRQRDERPSLDAAGDRLENWVRGALSDPPDRSEHTRAARRLIEQRASRPDLASCSDAALSTRIGMLRGELREALRLHAHAELATAVANELLTRATEDAGHPGLTGALVAGLGGAVTEQPVSQLWQTGRLIRQSDRLRQLFGQGLSSVAAQLAGASNGEVGRLRSVVAGLRTEHGHHGPAEWELAADTWGTEPRLILSVLDVLRRAGDEPDPAARAALRAGHSAESTATVRRSMRDTPRALARFDTALGAASSWLLTRQRIHQVVSGLHHEQRLAARELGRRHVATGLLDSVDQIFMLLVGELDQFVAEPEQFGESLRMRAYDYHALATYQPPFVTLGQPPPVVRWPRGSTAKTLVGRRGITGTAVSPGAAGGPAKVLRSAALPAGLHPGDVLVAPSAGPAWVPLLPVVAAVVTDAGAALSALAVACRDLGIPCVVATVDATTRISNGATVEVDGFAGTVRLTGRGEDGGRPPPTQVADQPTTSSA
jgi:rifampicin phosphotransferase